MIERLITRTELALNKHHNAKKNMIAQENKALAQAIAQSSSSVALTGTRSIQSYVSVELVMVAAVMTASAPTLSRTRRWS
jgi:hypothetical protein